MVNPCSGCSGQCCQGKGFEREAPLLEEDFGKYKTYLKDGIEYLERKENFDCIYFTEQGCSIHETRPMTCRVFYCWQWLPEGLPKHVEKEALKRI